MRVVIADDAVLIRSGIATLLWEAGIEPVGLASDAGELIDLVETTTPDAAIVDIRMPPTHTDEGIVAARKIRQEHPGVAVLVLSQYVESSYAMRLLEEDPGGMGYLLKDRIVHAATLTDALRRVVAGECVVDQAIVGRLLARARQHSPLDTLTPREQDVLALMAEGRSNSGICQLLTLSPKTVETHVNRVFMKLGLADQGQGHRRVLAVLAYLRQGAP
jgi:DNA-binding NarL/FixJ family response regulator